MFRFFSKFLTGKDANAFANMEQQEKWSSDYQQSGSDAHKQNDNPAVDFIGTQIKEEPDGKSTSFPVKEEFSHSGIFISENSRQTIQLILGQIKTLSQNDKYLLYLKLPSEISDIVDPFRQPLNPLGSRSEISRTIVWIQTHLEEDQNISMPKKVVYNEYEQYCDKNNIKPLSQADFGKVMKQVFPKVRARRLGQRGNSKYCYSGLRRRVTLDAPILPDLIDKPLSTEGPVNHASVTYAAWLIIKDWAYQQLGVSFNSLQALAHYLVRNCAVGSGSDAACKLTSNVDSQPKSEDTTPKTITKHREMQLQLQKKIKQKNEVKERKRKLQPNKAEPKPGPKKCRSHSVPASTITTSGLSHDSGIGHSTTPGEGTSSSSAASSSCGSTSVSPTQQQQQLSLACDNSSALPDFKSFQKPQMENKSPAKVAIPRLPPVSPQKPVVVPPIAAKYKSIQLRLQPCDIATYNAPTAQPNDAASVVPVPPALADERSQILQCVQQDVNTNNDKTTIKPPDDLPGCDDEDFPLTRERLDSVSNVEKDAMDEYLGTNTSQHEEELSKYFHGAPSLPVDVDQNSKLSTLRQLLEQNGINDKRVDNIIPDFPYVQPMLPLLHTRRRVSFETLPEEVPASPNTRSKNFNFTPISPGPHSPSTSSTNASPFVSPRNTPIQKKNKIKVKKELSLEINADMNYMSAPVSPMLPNNKSMLQKLLNANSKVQYTPEYAQSIQPDSTQFFNDLSRSQSVPLIQDQLMFKSDPSDLMVDNNNINYNLDLSNHQNLNEYGLNFVNSCADQEFVYKRGLTRSQSIDVASRSVPSTPLPFPNIKLPDNTKNYRSYPNTPLSATDSFVYVNGDCLLNGTPIRADSSEFLPGFGEAPLEGDLGLMESEEIMGGTDILIQQGFSSNIN